MKDGGGEVKKKWSSRGSVHRGCDYATPLNIEVDPQRRRFGRRESDFALQALIEGCAAKLERNESELYCCDGIPVAVKCASGLLTHDFQRTVAYNY